MARQDTTVWSMIVQAHDMDGDGGMNPTEFISLIRDLISRHIQVPLGQVDLAQSAAGQPAVATIAAQICTGQITIAGRSTSIITVCQEAQTNHVGAALLRDSAHAGAFGNLSGALFEAYDTRASTMTSTTQRYISSWSSVAPQQRHSSASQRKHPLDEQVRCISLSSFFRDCPYTGHPSSADIQ